MAMKVQSSPMPAVGSTQTQESQRAVPPDQGAARANAHALPDGFEGRRPAPDVDIDKLLGNLKPRLNIADRLTAADLHKDLSTVLNTVDLALDKKSESLSRDENGVFRGPQGQPLMPVKLDDGHTAYVDPNTNRYYLTDEKPDAQGKVNVLPARDLPQGSKFSNTYFNDKDVKDLTKIAQDQSPFGPWLRPQPQPEPWLRPRPQPRFPSPELPKRETPDFGPLRSRNIAV